jgi:MFS family permease
VRAFVALAINGSYWAGTALGALLSSVLLDPRVLGHEYGWRAAFVLGAVLAVAILLVRRFVPESPRWLLLHGREQEARAIVGDIEQRAHSPAPEEALETIGIQPGTEVGLGRVARVVFLQYRQASCARHVADDAQAFFYNAISFTYGLTLANFYGTPPERVGAYILPFALAIFSDRCVSELVPLELRAMAIALFYAVGTGVGGLAAPVLFGVLIESGSRSEVFMGYALGSALMIGAAFVCVWLGVAAEGRSLEDIAPPLSRREAE